MNRFFLLASLGAVLMNEAGENPEGGGGAPAPAAAPPEPPADETPETPAPAPAASASAPVKPGFLASAIAAAKGNGALSAENVTLRGQVGALTAQVSALTAERDGLAARVTALEGERAQIQAALDTANATAQSVQASTIDALAAVNVPRNELPAAAAPGAGGLTLEALQAQLEAETDPAKRGALSNQIWDAMKAKQKAA